MPLWRSDVEKLLPGEILTISHVDHDGGEHIEVCDKLRVVKIMSQTQNWNCTEEEAVERIKQTSEEFPFVLGGEKFWYQAIL